MYRYTPTGISYKFLWPSMSDVRALLAEKKKKKKCCIEVKEDADVHDMKRFSALKIVHRSLIDDMIS